MTATTPTPSPWLATALDALLAGDTDAWTNLYNDDAVHEFPFAPEQFPSRLEGKAAIGAYMRGLPNMIEFAAFDDVQTHEVGDDLLIAELRGHGRLVTGGAPFQMRYVWFITFRNGLVSHFRDYMNPLQLPSA